MTEKINLDQKFAPFDELWRPKVDRGDDRPGTQAGQRSRANFLGIGTSKKTSSFSSERGGFVSNFATIVEMGPGEGIVVARGVEHRICADEEAEVLLFEPSGTVNTGNVVDAEQTAPTRIVI